MMILFAGNGKKQEDDALFLSMSDKIHKWGILISYKDMVDLKKNIGNARFRKLIKRRKNVLSSPNNDETVILRTKKQRKRRQTNS